MDLNDKLIFDDIMMMIAKLENMTPEEVERSYQRRLAERKMRIARHEARWQSLLNRMTEKCLEKVDAVKRQGGSINKLYTHKYSGNVAAMMVRPNVWDGAKGKMGRKIIMIYPDGSQVETLEKTISIKRDF